MTDRNLRTEDIDLLGQALITLTQELWVVKDRLRILEATLADSGTLPPAAVDQYQPGEELLDSLSDERARLINQVLGALAPKA